MLTLLASHGLFDLRVAARGDLHVDEHHTAEDVAICLGKALDQALGDRAGIVRTAHSYVPMDEALGFVAVDLGGRPYCVFEAEWRTPRLGGLGTDLIGHIFETLAIHGRLDLHARVLYARNDHHACEACSRPWPGAGRGHADRPAAPRCALYQRCVVMQWRLALK